VLGAVIAAVLVESKPVAPEAVAADQELVSVELAA